MCIAMLKEEGCMLKFATMFLFLLLSFNAFCEECAVSQNLQASSCANEYFQAKTENDLNEYLLHGKFKQGKLLNLELDFPLSSKEIKIATPCTLKIAKKLRVTAKQNGICLKGLSIIFEGENQLISENKASINVYASESILIKKSILSTEGDLKISTSLFLPIDGSISILEGSKIRATRVHIQSKSNLEIDRISQICSEHIKTSSFHAT
jgi:hypothetical protein